ncbi:MAG: hypothetical protein LBD47_11515 [Treponema sp.]|nr:hypothetical protein [Treponema sp.]
MFWSVVLYLLSFLPLGLGIYMLYTGWRSGRIPWMLPLAAIDAAIWIPGITMAAESRSSLIAGMDVSWCSSY